MAWRIEFSENARGTSPPRVFMRGLPPRDRSKVIRALELLEEFGLALGDPYVKSLAGHRGLYELRVRSRSDAFRLFFFTAGKERVVIVHGIRKKTEKTPQRDFATAEERRAEYLRRR